MGQREDRKLKKVRKGLESRVLPRDAYVAYKGIKVHVVRIQNEGWGLSHKSNRGDSIICVCVCVEKVF